MSSNHSNRRRRPVISIQTQPEEETTLRAEIKAAQRTQHEILPRYSWHSTFMKRDNASDLKRTYPPVLQKDSQLSHAPEPDILEANEQENESLPRSGRTTKKSRTLLSRGPLSNATWRPFIHRPSKSDTSGSNYPNSISSKPPRRQESKRQKNDQATDVITDRDRAVQEAQWNDWLEEIIEEQNIVPDLPLSSTPKSKQTLRKSVYGSLSSTKSFFRTPSKSSLARLYSRAGISLLSTPHVYSFEDKDHLREYLNGGSLVSPMSPKEQKFNSLEQSQNASQPVELSAGPVPAELEDNSLNTMAQTLPTVSRTSTPSIRDLPPYVEERRFSCDMAKDQDNQSFRCPTILHSDSNTMSGLVYTCSSCQNKIISYDIYDFCSKCNSSSCVLCTKCAGQGSHCRREPKQLTGNNAPAHKNLASLQIRRKAVGNKPNDVLSSLNVAKAQSNHSFSDSIHQVNNAAPSPFDRPSSPRRAIGVHPHTALHSSNDEEQGVQLAMLKELGYLHREQDLRNREREVALRAKELEIRDQAALLREREFAFHQKSDALVQGLQNLVNYQELAKGAFIGAQFQTQYSAEMDQMDFREVPPSKDDAALYASTHDATAFLHRSRPSIVKVVAAAEASIQNLGDNDSYIKSCTAPKRKKGGASGSSNSSPAAISSPEQPRKPLSRGDSGRDGNPDEDEDEDNRRHPKKHKHEPPTPTGPQLLFACPYAKNNPGRYSSRNTSERNYRGCGTHYLPDVSRLKQHLRRVHWQPETYCPRCYEEFENSTTLMEHAKAIVACQTRDCPFPEKMDKTQQEKIHVKRPRVHPKTVWYDIYKVLFPGQPLPESPYMEGEDRVITPLSAVPQSTIDAHAIRTFSSSFNKQLDRHEGLQQSPLRSLIQQAFDESFKEFLQTFTISPNASPGGPPSIIVSPVSRSSSDAARPSDSPAVGIPRAPELAHQRSVTNVPRVPQRVPLLQQPQPRSKLKTALQVPTDHHRSPSRQSRGSQGAESPLDSFINISLPRHVTEDQGWGDDCYSFEAGDDLPATAPIGRPAMVSARNKSVGSLDSGYGSGRSRQQPNSLTPIVDTSSSTPLQGVQNPMMMAPTPMGTDYRPQPQYVQQESDITPELLDQRSVVEHTLDGFPGSYYHLLDPSAQEDIMNGMDYSLFDSQNPWNSL